VGFVTLPGLTLFSLYFLGILAAVVVAFVMRRTALRGGKPLYVMELPAYRMPSWRSILITVAERCVLFLQKAGTVILAVSIVLWFLASYPRGSADERALDAQVRTQQAAGHAAQAQALENERPGLVLRNSFAGRVGHVLEPAITPLGFDWRIGIGLVTSFAAREVMVSTMATVFNLGEAHHSTAPLATVLRTAIDPATGRRAYTALTGISLMVFFALACQCMSTVAVVRRETNSWRWPITMIVLMNAMAWAASFVIYQGGRMLGFG
jgi:ferrous iron transport protein B